jgi:hypothetical protein
MSNDGFSDDAVIREWFKDDYLDRDKAAKLTERERHKLLSAAQDVFKTDAGKRLLCWLLSETHIYQRSFTGNSLTYFREGEREVGLKVFGLLVEAEPNAMQELVNFKRKEGIEDER